MSELKTRIIDPKALSPDALERFVDDIFPVYQSVFANYERAGVAKGLTADAYALVRVQTMHDESGRTVGLAIFRVHETEFKGRPIAAVRVGLAVERSYRGGAPFGAFLAGELLKYKVAHPRRTLYGFDLVVHPSSYLAATRLLGDCWPHWERETPADMHELAVKLADAFGGARIDGAHPLARGVPVYTRETEAERAYWQHSDRPDVRFYLRLNPDYALGRALAFVFPLSVGAVLEGVARLGWRTLERQVAAAESALQEFGLYTGVEALDAPALLRRCAVFSDLSPGAVDQLAARAERKSVPAGRYLFRQGDAGDALYIVREGQALVLLDVGAPDPIVVDQIGPGEVFGEIALLLPQPRSASVRALQSVELLRIGRDDLDALVAGDPAIAHGLWRAVARRSLRSHMLGSPRFEGLTRARREAWLEHADYRRLDRGGTLTVDRPGWVHVIDGAVERASGAEWMDAGRRSFFPVRPGHRLVAYADSHLAMLPPE